jgi:hypothetical protein
MRIRRTIAWATWALIATWLILCAIGGIFAAEAALHPTRNHITPADGDRAQQLATANNAQLTNVAIEAADRATLRAWVIIPAQSNGDAVILLHGQADNRAGMLGPAAMLLRHHFAVLLPDARAHGESGGNIATYGVLERDDIRRWFDWLTRTDHPRCIDGLGDSMGAAQLLQSLSVEHGFCAIAAESAFSSFREVAYDRMGQRFNTRPWLGRTFLHPAIDFGFLYARMKYKVDLAQASPLNAIAATPTPVLLIHGLADTNIPPRHSEQMKLSDVSAQLWEPPNADHCGASDADPAGYETHLITWFQTHDSRRSQ